MVTATAAAAVTAHELLSLLSNKHIEFKAHAICEIKWHISVVNN